MLLSRTRRASEDAEQEQRHAVEVALPNALLTPTRPRICSIYELEEELADIAQRVEPICPCWRTANNPREVRRPSRIGGLIGALFGLQG